MKKLIVTSAAFLLLVAPLVMASPALAANQLTFNADATIDLTNPDVNITVMNGSIADSITPGAGTISITISSGGSITLRSADRKTLSQDSALSSTFTCGLSASELQITGGANATTLTVTVASDACTSSSSSTSGSVILPPSGGAATPTPATPKTATPEPAKTTEPATGAQETNVTPTTGGAASFAQQLANILSEATDVITSDAKAIAEKTGMTRNTASEATASSKYIGPLLAKTVAAETENVTNAMTNFVAYGTQTTKALGTGERAGVLNSFENAYDKLPETEIDWQDIIKIANGRFPTQQSVEKEKGALATFGKIYLRMPDFKNTRDEAALKIIAYGIRPTSRKTDSEKSAIKTFKNIYGKNPSDTTDWDIARAIAYSGAKR